MIAPKKLIIYAAALVFVLPIIAIGVEEIKHHPLTQRVMFLAASIVSGYWAYRGVVTGSTFSKGGIVHRRDDPVSFALIVMIYSLYSLGLAAGALFL
jgi:hypothetical protein